MASKGIPFVDERTGGACTSYGNFRVKVGVGMEGTKLLKADQFIVTCRSGEAPSEAVSRRHAQILVLLSRYASNGTQQPLVYARR